ncbi:MAG: hypothetical protein PVF82_02035 [Gammaproteobacteria bacterium]|jgi:hypothetical protein
MAHELLLNNSQGNSSNAVKFRMKNDKNHHADDTDSCSLTDEDIVALIGGYLAIRPIFGFINRLPKPILRYVLKRASAYKEEEISHLLDTRFAKIYAQCSHKSNHELAERIYKDLKISLQKIQAENIGIKETQIKEYANNWLSRYADIDIDDLESPEHREIGNSHTQRNAQDETIITNDVEITEDTPSYFIQNLMINLLAVSSFVLLGLSIANKIAWNVSIPSLVLTFGTILLIGVIKRNAEK